MTFMKKTILILGSFTLIFAISLQAYFTFIPPPEPTLEKPLSELVPNDLPGWEVQDLKIADTPESSARISDFLKFDDAIFRSFKKGDTEIGLYIAYWSPGKASYRWAGAHTPDTCWVQAGWDCTKREYKIPFQHNGIQFEPAEYGVYETKNDRQNVYFWHLVGNEAYSYKQHNEHNIFGALIDIKDHGLNLRKEQFFIRLSSNQSIEQLKQIPEFNKILDSLATLGLANSPEITSP